MRLGLSRGACEAALITLQRLPPLESGQEQHLDLLEPLAIGTDLRRALQVVVGSAHPGGDPRLLALQRLDLRRESGELALLLVAQACARSGRGRSCRFGDVPTDPVASRRPKSGVSLLQ